MEIVYANTWVFLSFRLAGISLWNNLLEPVNRKTKRWRPAILYDFKCPTRESPYLFTHSNSQL